MTTTTRQDRRTDADVVYPETDGKPMAENTRQFRWIVTIKEGIEAEFANDPMVFVAGDLFWYPVKGEPDLRTAPDVLVVFGRPKGDRPSYLQWLEDGVAPQVVFEVLSPGNRPGAMREKFAFYEQYGVEEYYIYDPDRGTLEGWLRADDALRPIAAMNGHVSPRLGIRFEPGAGPDNLTIVGRNGKPYVEVLELHRQLDAGHRRIQAERRRTRAAQRARDEAQQARDEAQRACDDAQRLAERLAAKLRALGAEPD